MKCVRLPFNVSDNWECAQLLVDYGASLNHTDCHFGTPLHAAVYKGSINSVKVLLKAGNVMTEKKHKKETITQVSVVYLNPGYSGDIQTLNMWLLC